MADTAESIRFIYTTVPSLEEAERIARVLLDRRLAACANILPGMVSLYWWKGQIERAQEVVMVVKTTAAPVDEVLRAISEAHPYEVPALAVLPIERTSPLYGAWIAEEVAAGADGRS